MIGALAKAVSGAVIGDVLDGVKDLYKTYQHGKISEQEYKIKEREIVEKALVELGAIQADVIKTEINSESWLTSNWRPVMALCATFVLIIWYGFLVPIAVNWFGMPALAVGDDLLKWVYTLITIALTGYIASRGYEKAHKKG